MAFLATLYILECDDGSRKLKMKIGVAQINSTVGDLEGNLQIASSAYAKLVSEGSELVIFPELALCGYPPRDLLLKKSFGDDCSLSLESFARETGPFPALIGFPEKRTSDEGRPFHNSVALCRQGKIQQVFRKRLLPTYDVFDEDRYFAPGRLPMCFTHLGKKIGVTICEDLWFRGGLHGEDPLDEICRERPDLLVNLSASPWHLGKMKTRLALLRSVASRTQAQLAYVNLVGGNDELIFDGSSIFLNQQGLVVQKLVSFAETTLVFDLDEDSSLKTIVETDDYESVHKALMLGLGDYARKSGFKKAIIGLSGGIDSAVTATLAVQALGKENVIGISLPSAISSEHSKDDALALARNLGIEFHTLPIEKIVNSADSLLAPLFQGLPPDVTEENVQARARGLLLMALSNKFGALLLTTGNKSELAVGYCTLYGDMCGGLAVLSDLPKSQVFALAKHLNRSSEVIPQNTILKPPSAELRPNQMDSDSLPDYDLLDAILHEYVENGASIRELIGSGFEESTVRRIVELVDRNEYKRKQAAPGLKITPLAFGIGRRMPIVQKYSN